MDIKEYLREKMLDGILEELLRIDNEIMEENISLRDINYLFENVKFFSVDNSVINVISDGNLEKVTNIVLNYFPFIENLYVDKNYLGYFSWLVAKVNDYLLECGSEHKILLNTSNLYGEFIKSNNKILLCGEDEFILEMKEFFKDKELSLI